MRNPHRGQLHSRRPDTCAATIKRRPLIVVAAALLLVGLYNIGFRDHSILHSLKLPSQVQRSNPSSAADTDGLRVLRQLTSPAGLQHQQVNESWASFADAPVSARQLDRFRRRSTAPANQSASSPSPPPSSADPYVVHYYEEEDRPLPAAPLKLQDFQPLALSLSGSDATKGAGTVVVGLDGDGPPAGDPVVVRTESVVAEDDPNKQHTNQASSIVQVGPGEFLVAWLGGTEVNASDVSIWTARLRDGRWQAPTKAEQPISQDHSSLCGAHLTPPVSCKHQNSTWNPVLSLLSDDELLLFYKTGPHPSEWTGWVMRSRDAGHTWGPPTMLPPPITGPARHKPIMLPNGVILAGASTESWHGEKRHAQCWIDYSEDDGRTWQRHGPIPSAGDGSLDQPLLWIGSDMKINMLARSATSSDNDVKSAVPLQQGNDEAPLDEPLAHPLIHVKSDRTGLYWPQSGSPVPTLPASSADVLRLKDSRVLVVHNRSTGRGPSTLVLSMSIDGGVTWKDVVEFENSLPTDVAQECSDPSIIQAQEGEVHITCTFRRSNIRHVVVDPRALKPWPQRKTGKKYIGVNGHYDTTGPKWRPRLTSDKQKPEAEEQEL